MSTLHIVHFVYQDVAPRCLGDCFNNEKALRRILHCNVPPITAISKYRSSMPSRRQLDVPRMRLSLQRATADSESSPTTHIGLFD